MKRVLILLFFGCNYVTTAQDFDCKPKTCTMQQVGGYYIELAGCRNTLDIYIYNTKLEPVRLKQLGGHVEFYYNDQSMLRSEFIQYHFSNGLSAKIVAPEFIYCKLILTIDFDIIDVTFQNECDLSTGSAQGAKMQEAMK